MFSFLGRSKVTCRSLAETMAPKLVTAWIQEYDEELRKPGDNSWVEHARMSKSDAKAKQEWLLLCLAAFLQGCHSSMGESDLHFRFAGDFLEVCGREVELQRIFSTANEFIELSKLRSTEYWSLLSESDPGGSIRLVAARFLQNAGCSPIEIAHSMTIASAFTSTATTTKDLFDKLKRTVRLVLS